MSSPDPGAYLAPADVAARLNVSRRTVTNLLASGDLASIKIAHRVVRITPEALAAYVSEHTRNAK